MVNVKLIIEYDGTRYHGWQRQNEVATIQDTLEKAINKITGENITVNGSGRTDKGVHARGQVASFYTGSNIPAHKFKLALNSVLSYDISIRESLEVDEDFHARYSAIGKEYEYIIYNNRVRSPIVRNYSYHVPYELNITRMKEASENLIGTHDFKAFMASGTNISDTIRTIYHISINKSDDIIKLYFRGNGFLYNMVRIMVGTLVEIGSNKMQAGHIKEIVNSLDRIKAGHTAPPQGLYLNKVFYK